MHHLQHDQGTEQSKAEATVSARDFSAGLEKQTGAPLLGDGLLHEIRTDYSWGMQATSRSNPGSLGSR